MSNTLWTSAAMALALGAGAATAIAPAPALAQVSFDLSINVGFAPPELPVYDQPPPPEDGDIWTPGYWAWDNDDGDYYWVPGTWVEPPREDLLWTPGYWDYDNGRYLFVPGYWDTEVGYYGGVDYGYGYDGDGYRGGEWRNHTFFYNRTENNFAGVHIANMYVGATPQHGSVRASFSGGPGGAIARPTAQQQTEGRRPHVAATPIQMQHIRGAAAEPALRASVNHGAPAIAATPRPAAFNGPGVAGTTAAPRVYQRPARAPPPQMTAAPRPAPTAPPPEQARPQQDFRRAAPESSPPRANDQSGQTFMRPTQPLLQAPPRQQPERAQPAPHASQAAHSEAAHPAPPPKPQPDKDHEPDQPH